MLMNVHFMRMNHNQLPTSSFNKIRSGVRRPRERPIGSIHDKELNCGGTK